MNPGENLRAPKESAASEVLNIVSGPGIQVTADVFCSENGSSIACSRPHLGVLDLGLGVQSEAISSDTKGNTKEMKAGGKVCCPLHFSLLLRTAVPLQRILVIFCCVQKPLLRGWGRKGANRARQAESCQTVPVHHIWQGSLSRRIVWFSCIANAQRVREARRP